MTSKSYKTSLLRGALGGLLGGVIGAVILRPRFPYARDTSDYIVFFVIFLICYLPFTGILGGLIGITICWIQTKANRNVGLVIKSIIAAILGGLVGVLTDFVVLTETTLAILGHYYTKYGVIVGVVSGVIVGLQRNSKPSSLTQA